MRRHMPGKSWNFHIPDAALMVPGSRRSAALADGRPDASPGDAALPVHPLPSGALDGGPRRMQSTARLLR